MAKAGAHLQEYALLDAQHFGIPQRRRRVFLISCFDSATADRCPEPLLPVTESLRGDTKKSQPKRQSAALTLTEGVGGDGAIVNAIGASIYHKQTVVNQDVNSGHLVTEGGILGSDIVGPLNTSDAKMISTQYVNENKCVVEPYLAFDTQFGSNANVTENIAPTLKSSQQSPSVAYPIQDGREIEKHQNGFGVASDGEPSYTLDQTGAQAVAYSVREDAKANTFSATELDHANALSALRPSPQSHHAQMFIAQPMAVRRLTPLECERLMGWPDDHTRYKADGVEQADTHRYKQCGNGVATPVAKWVAGHIARIEYAER
jgi:DNA (cytosine-5)-methyltransferase 1